MAATSCSFGSSGNSFPIALLYSALNLPASALRSAAEVLLHALLRLHLVDELLEVLLADLHHDVGEHLDEAAVAVPRPARVLRLLREGVDDRLVEAEVEDRVHHARHRGAGAGAHGDEERVLRVAELLAGGLLELAHVLHDLAHDVVRDHAAVVVVARARLGGDREALRHREPEARHPSPRGSRPCRPAARACWRCLPSGPRRRSTRTSSFLPFVSFLLACFSSFLLVCFADSITDSFLESKSLVFISRKRPRARPAAGEAGTGLNVSLSQCLRRSRVSGLRSHHPFPTPRAWPAAGEAGTGALT